MSPDGTKKMGDLHELPACAPEGLKALFTVAEGVIQKQIRLLGSGNPSEAPDLRQVLRNEGITRPEDQATMLDRYSDHEDKVQEVKSDYERQDDGISVRTTRIGEVVTNAYDAIDTAVGELNAKIDAAHGQVRTVTDNEGNPVTDAQGNVKKELPNSIVSGLFTGLWDALNTTYEQVSGVSDRAAAEALGIVGDETTYTHSNYNGSPPPMSFPTSSYSGSGGSGSGSDVSYTSASTGTAIVPSGDKPSAMKMMEYLMDEHGFSAAQAAAIVANAKFESGFDVTATGDDGSAHGLFQWRFDRWEGLQEFAQQPGESLGDWRTHIDYMVQELRGGGYGDAQRMVDYAVPAGVADTDPERARDAAEAFDRHYERSSGSTINARREYAAGLLQEWESNNSSPSSMAV